MAKYNLIIFHVPRRQQLSDFLTIRNMMAGRAPDIDVHVIPTAIPIPADFCRQAAERPTLIFSPMPLRLDPKFRGARLITCDRKKSEEVEMLTRAGFPVPDTRTINPGSGTGRDGLGPFQRGQARCRLQGPRHQAGAHQACSLERHAFLAQG